MHDFFICSKVKNLKSLLLTLRSIFHKKLWKSKMIAAIFWLLPMWAQVRKWAAGYIVPSLTRLKTHGYKLNFFVSFFPKPRSNQGIKYSKVATFLLGGNHCLNFFIIPNCKIYLFGKKKLLMEFLASSQGTHRTLQVVRWPCEPIILSIGHFEGPTEVQLNSW